MKEVRLKSCLKYCGGKAKLLPRIMEHLPADFHNYFEPFVGGASVVLGIMSKDIKDEYNREYTISDINGDLINCYNVIKSRLPELLTELGDEKYKNETNSFYLHRIRFNQIKFNANDEDKVECAALFIYLNKCCFNGMHRQNSKGMFNVPFGKMKNPLICDTETLSNISNAFEKTGITSCSYKEILEETGKCDLVYLDPPYHGTNMFTDYTNNVFGENEQRELKLFVDELTSKGVYVILSNSATDFIKELYSDYNIINLTTKYSLGGKNADRGEKQEVLITNFMKN